ncbi:uncharacterized protein [Antedon mediterranea]|uniref:uncharacterized protein isoform X2 n=1 Tax=Antedon mediterranea TaxID=105859 RepID=UPI003AF660D1
MPWMKKINIFILFCVFVIVNCKASRVTIATYNLWNVMFNWEVRKQYVANKLLQLDVDFIAFQEVRSHQSSSWSQLHELQHMLPTYKWLLYQPVQKVIPPKYGAPIGWEMEGMGILSRLPITSHTLQSLVQKSRLDRNKRVVLHANVQSGEHSTSCSIILGDFNTYTNYEWPVLALKAGKFSITNKCSTFHQHGRRNQVEIDETYIDVWTQAYPTDKGYTFSNMPEPGFESRPDRILVSHNCAVVLNAQLAGVGSEYKNQFENQILWNRYWSLFKSAKSSYYAYSGSSCYFDCGPHASCRCGICVAGGDKNDCLLPNCSECSSTVFRKIITLAIVTLYIIFNIFYTIINFIKPFKTCNLGNLVQKKQKYFYSKEKKMCRNWWMYFCLCFYRIPIIFMIILNLCFVIGIYVLCLNILKDSLSSINAIIQEEFNPSDHLMLISQLKLV